MTKDAGGAGDGTGNTNFVIIEPEDENKGAINLQEYFSSMVPEGKHYQVNKNGLLLELVIADNGNYITYCIDPDIVMGNGYNILANVPQNNTIFASFVNLKHKKIVAKMVNDKAYVLTPEEMSIVRGDMFINDNIYHSIDMSGMSGVISKLTKEEFSKLGKKLSGVINTDMVAIHNQVPRMRFSQFNSIDDFELVSDYRCISPLAGVTSREIHEGLVVSVKGDSIAVDLNDGGDVVLYTIQYGVI